MTAIHWSTMAGCENCGAQLAPEWKFCIYCGERVVRDVPGAIRPDGAAPVPARRVSPGLVFGLIMLGLGVTLAIAAVLMFTVGNVA